jgi:hypothetical protein
MAVGSIKKEQIGDAFSKVTMINFNYDRIIEHFIYSELQSKFGVSDHEAKNVILNLKMVRPYGAVGHLPWQGGSSTVSFGAHLGNDHDKFFTFADNIHTYTEQKLEETMRQEIEVAIASARLIVFLGFGFHQQNMEILKVKDRAGAKQVIATVLGIDEENYVNIRPAISADLVCTSVPQLLPRRAADLLLTMKSTIVNPRREMT